MPTSREPTEDAIGPGKGTKEKRPLDAAPSKPAPALDHSQEATGEQSVETVPISIAVPKGLVVIAVTTKEAEAVERSRMLASRGRLFKLMPRDWTTPLALLIPLLAALVTDISNQGVHAVFVAATVLAFIWLILAIVGRVTDAVKAKEKADRAQTPPVLK